MRPPGREPLAKNKERYTRRNYRAPTGIPLCLKVVLPHAPKSGHGPVINSPLSSLSVREMNRVCQAPSCTYLNLLNRHASTARALRHFSNWLAAFRTVESGAAHIPRSDQLCSNQSTSLAQPAFIPHNPTTPASSWPLNSTTEIIFLSSAESTLSGQKLDTCGGPGAEVDTLFRLAPLFLQKGNIFLTLLSTDFSTRHQLIIALQLSAEYF